MSIRTILRSEFDRLLPHDPILEDYMLEQVEWFSNQSGTLLGAIAKGENHAGWNYAIFKQDRHGDFHIRKVMNNRLNLKAVRDELLVSMAGIAIDKPAPGIPSTSATPSGVANRTRNQSDVSLAV